MMNDQNNKLVGRMASYQIKGMRVPVVVRGVRDAFGRVDVRIMPVGGEGEVWVNSRAIKLYPRPPAESETIPEPETPAIEPKQEQEQD